MQFGTASVFVFDSEINTTGNMFAFGDRFFETFDPSQAVETYICWRGVEDHFFKCLTPHKLCRIYMYADVCVCVCGGGGGGCNPDMKVFLGGNKNKALFRISSGRQIHADTI